MIRILFMLYIKNQVTSDPTMFLNTKMFLRNLKTENRLTVCCFYAII